MVAVSLVLGLVAVMALGGVAHHRAAQRKARQARRRERRALAEARWQAMTAGRRQEQPRIA